MGDEAREDDLWWKAAREGVMDFRAAVEGHHSSLLEGLRHGDLDRAHRAVDAVRSIVMREDAKAAAGWRAEQVVRWKAYAAALGALDEGVRSWKLDGFTESRELEF